MQGQSFDSLLESLKQPHDKSLMKTRRKSSDSITHHHVHFADQEVLEKSSSLTTTKKVSNTLPKSKKRKNIEKDDENENDDDDDDKRFNKKSSQIASSSSTSSLQKKKKKDKKTMKIHNVHDKEEENEEEEKVLNKKDKVRDLNLDAEEEEEEDEEEEEEEGDDDKDDDGLSMKRHRADLEALSIKDPAFYAYMQKNSANLLEFGEEEEEEDEEEEEEEEENEEDEEDLSTRVHGKEKSTKNKKKSSDDDDDNDVDEDDNVTTGRSSSSSTVAELLTLETARQVLNSAFEEKSLKGLQLAIKAFRAACFSGDSAGLYEGGIGGGGDNKDEAEDDFERKKKWKKKASISENGLKKSGKEKTLAEESIKRGDSLLKKLHYRISSSKVFHLVITEVLTRAGSALVYHLGAIPHATLTTKDSELICPEGVSLSKFAGYTRINSLSKSLIVCSLHLLEASSDSSMLTFILRNLRLYIPFCQGFGSLSRKLTRSLFIYFSTNEDASVRIAAYMRIRQCALVLPYPSIDKCLKGAYMSYVRASKSVSIDSLSNQHLLANCVADLYGIDEASSYTHAFIYLRQLAIHLRAALTTRSEQTISMILSWQFISCLRVWTLVLCRFAKDEKKPLYQLVYPLVQIIIGAYKLHPATRYSPLRLHLISNLIELGWATNVYIPVAPMILQVLTSTLSSSSSSSSKGTKSSSSSLSASSAATAPPLSILVKATAAVQATRAYQDALVSQCFEHLLDYLKSHFYNIAFPEIMAPCALSLRKFAKETRVGHWRARAKSLIDTITGQGIKIATKRNTFEGSPSDLEACKLFMEKEKDSLKRERVVEREKKATSEIIE
jgi:nucleolar complex protein 2